MTTRRGMPSEKLVGNKAPPQKEVPRPAPSLPVQRPLLEQLAQGEKQSRQAAILHARLTQLQERRGAKTLPATDLRALQTELEEKPKLKTDPQMKMRGTIPAQPPQLPLLKTPSAGLDSRGDSSASS